MSKTSGKISAAVIGSVVAFRRTYNILQTRSWQIFALCVDWLMAMHKLLKDYIKNSSYRHIYQATRCFQICIAICVNIGP